MNTATIVLEVFPAEVEGPDGIRFRQARVLVRDDGYVYVFTADRTAPRLAHAFMGDGFDHETVSRLRPRQWTVTSNVGEEWTVTTGGGCGCGNPLKHLAGQTLLNLVP